ncbi:DUF2283 domain-containing protein [Kineococcus sp. R8]|nr:DUF2283 domain-containing protein [Kineococcus siccus]
MHSTWDAEADAAYVDLRGEDSSQAVEQVMAYTAPGRYEVILDLSAAGKLLGVEVIGAEEALDPAFLRTLQRIDDGASAG